MEDARIELKISRMEWKAIFHTRFYALYLQCWVVTNSIVTEVFIFIIYGYYKSR